eukprot:3189741-Prymnesium_polylepis.1
MPRQAVGTRKMRSSSDGSSSSAPDQEKPTSALILYRIPASCQTICKPPTQCVVHLKTLGPTCDCRTVTDGDDENDKQRDAHQGDGASGHVTAVVALSIQLVKVPGVLCGAAA